MKRKLFVILVFFLCSVAIYAEEYPLQKVQEYSNNFYMKGLYLRPDSDIGYDDDSGNWLRISNDGTIYVNQYDGNVIYLLEKNTFTIEKEYIYSFSSSECLRSVSEKYFEISWNAFSDMLIEKETGNIKYRYEDLSVTILKTYYDEECDVLFFIDYNNNLYSIEHPSMNEAQNKANFKGPEDTIAMLNSGKYAPHLTAKNNVLWVDGLGYYWPGKVVNGIAYQYVSESKVSIFVPNNTLRFDFRSPDEEIESIEIHPCGDIYVLRMNWTTNTHSLYRVKNTWDPEWRASWYAAHPDAPGQELPSGNVAQVAASKVRTGYLNDDRIRLRKGPGTGTDSLGTYPINTTFTILENSGVKQTIDGVTSEWIKVRLNDGTEGYFYGQYVSEK